MNSVRFPKIPGMVAAAWVALSLAGAREARAQGFKVIHVCSTVDQFPNTLIQAPLPDGHFYGTTHQGGAFGYGSVFRMDAAGNFTNLHSFAGPPTDSGGPRVGLLLAADGFLYGAAYSTPVSGDFGGVFRLDTSGNNYSVHLQTGGTCDPNGSAPGGSVIQASDGHLYVPMSICGPPPPPVNTNGTIDEINAALDETVDGYFEFFGLFSSPVGHLVEGNDGKLYGMSGGSFGAPTYTGAIYSMPLGGANPTLVHGLVSTEGLAPQAPLVFASDDNLYGTTYEIVDAQGNGQFTGSIFRVAEDGTFQTMHTFNGADGRHPISGLMQASDGNLYGATSQGGIGELGVVYRLDLAGNYKVLAAAGDVGIGSALTSELVEGLDGKLYGTNYQGGGNGLGTIYTIDFSQKADSITPSSGPAAGGTPVTIAGTGFVSGATVSVGPAAATGVSVPDATHVDATTPANNPGTILNVKVVLPDTTAIMLNNAWFSDFLDVPTGDIFHDFVRKVLENGITAGCGGGNYCRNDPVRRDQMAVFLLKAEHGSSYLPPACTGIFPDVPCPGTFTNWIEQLAAENITGGCGGGNYCPGNPVTRAQMAVFLLKTEHGSAYTPPACAGIFGDVACPSPFADWIERLYAENVTGGCQTSPLLYCPTNSNTRGQMAVFLVKSFTLP